jgi:hypothetical protein
MHPSPVSNFQTWRRRGRGRRRKRGRGMKRVVGAVQMNILQSVCTIFMF